MTWVLQDLIVAFGWVRQDLIVAFGVLAMFVFFQGGPPKGSMALLESLFPGRSPRFYLLADLVVNVFFGTVIGKILYNPKSDLECFVAGAGWMNALQTLASRLNQKRSPAPRAIQVPRPEVKKPKRRNSQ